MRFLLPLLFLATAADAAPLPIDPLWKSESFRKTVTGSFGIDSRIEPRITTDEEFYLDKSAEAMAAEDREAAIATFTESSLLEESPIMLFSLATLQSQSEQAEAAVENFEKALELFPNFRDAHRNLAIVLVQQEKYEEAREHLIRAIELGSREGLTMGLLGYCHSIAGNHRAALDAYRLAVLTQPDERQWLLALAQTLRSLDEPTESASILQQLLEKTPQDIQLWLLQADAWVDLERTGDAIANLELARRADSLDPPGLVSLGHLYLDREQSDLAVERYEEALGAEEPVTLDRAVDILEYLANRQLWDETRRISERVESSPFYAARIDSEETATELLSRLTRVRALLELETGEPEKGAGLVEQWLEREPTDGLAILMLARFRQESGQREEAEMLLERAARDPEHAAAARLAHGKLLVDAGEYESALEHLEAALALDPRPGIEEYVRAVRELTE